MKMGADTKASPDVTDVLKKLDWYVNASTLDNSKSYVELAKSIKRHLSRLPRRVTGP